MIPLMLVLLMSAVPVALPIMFTVSMALGSKELQARRSGHPPLGHPDWDKRVIVRFIIAATYSPAPADTTRKLAWPVLWRWRRHLWGGRVLLRRSPPSDRRMWKIHKLRRVVSPAFRGGYLNVVTASLGELSGLFKS